MAQNVSLDILLERLDACRDIIRHLEAGPDTAKARALLDVLRDLQRKMVRSLADYGPSGNN